MAKQRHRPKKRFGQHFLRDQEILTKIISAAGIASSDHLIEIGPGQGAMTELLLKQGADVTVVEIDRDLAEELGDKFKGFSNFKLIQKDILEADWGDLVEPGRKNKIVANLPYNISTPLFFKFVQWREKIADMTVMVQKEVAERICHNGEKGKSKDYGVLSIISTIVFESNLLFKVAPGSFHPPPKVDSAVMKLTPRGVYLDNEQAFFNFIQRAFNQRRKLFLSFLKREEQELLSDLTGGDLDFLDKLRPENLLPEQFRKLFYERSIVG